MQGMTRRAALAGAAGAAVAGRVAAQPRAPAPLEFTTWQWEEPGFGPWWQELVAAFNAANPATPVQVTAIPFRDYLDQLTIRFASGRPPPLLELPSDSLGAFASQGWLEPLDARLPGTAVADGWSSLQRDMVWDGKVQGVLLMGYAFMLFHNQALLDAAGVPSPGSWAEFQAAVPRITDRARGVFGLSAVTTEYPTIPLDLIRSIVWSGGQLVEGGRYALTSPATVAAVEGYRTLVGGNAPPGINSTVARQLFTDGKTGFLVDGPWVAALLERAPPTVRPALRMGKAPFSPPLGGASNSLHIAAGQPQAVQDAAWRFIQMLAEPRWQRRYTEMASVPAPRQGVLTDELAAARPGLRAVNEAAVGVLSTTPANQSLRANYNEFNKILQRTAVRVLSTQEPVPAILRDAQAELEQAAPLG